MKRKRISEMKQEFVDSNECVRRWLEARQRKSVATAEQYQHLLFHYWLWLKDKGFADMQAVLDDFKEKKRQDREYEHNDMLKEYLLNDRMKLKSKSHREQVLSAIRSFYEFNRCALPREKIDLTVREFDRQRVREKLSLKPMTLRDLERLVSVMKVREQAMMLVMIQSGMGVGEFVHQFNICECRKEWLKHNGHVCEPVKVMEQLRERKFPIKIEIVGRKSNPEPYYTFIGRDAIEALKRYLNYRAQLIRNAQKRMRELEEKERAGKSLLEWETRALQNYRERLTKLTPEWKEGEPIFISNFLNPIQEANIQVAVRTAKKQTGLTDREFTPHTCRDIFKTTCAHCGVNDTISEFFIGHKLDAMGYNRLHEMFPEDIEAEYLKAEPTLNILSHAGMEVDKEAVERLKQENVDLRQRVDMLTKVVRRLVSELDKKEGISFDEQIKMLMVEKSKEEALEGLSEGKKKIGLRLPRD